MRVRGISRGVYRDLFYGVQHDHGISVLFLYIVRVADRISGGDPPDHDAEFFGGEKEQDRSDAPDSSGQSG